MIDNNLNKLNDEQFRRLTGVKRTRFEKMIIILSEQDLKKKSLLASN